MASFSKYDEFALNLPEVSTAPHFEKISYKVKGKIFITHSVESSIFCIKLSPEMQEIFALHPNGAITAINNKWGLQGWTNVEFGKLEDEMIKQLILSAYITVAPKILGDNVSHLLV